MTSRGPVTVPQVWIGWLAGYCQRSECGAREVRVYVKNHEGPMTVTPTCPLCQQPLNQDFKGWLHRRRGGGPVVRVIPRISPLRTGPEVWEEEEEGSA